MRTLLAVPALSAALLWTTTDGFLHQRQVETSFDWASVTPSEHLNYHDCFDGYRCARLKVPLDWSREPNSTRPLSSSASAIIAIVTLPATVPETDPSFGGTVLINPGGPGGPGTELALTHGNYFQSILDGDRHYEILGFDPRGIGLSTPFAKCYIDNLSRASDSIRKEGLPPITSNDALETYHQISEGVSMLCADDFNNIFQHMSTASVARDMLAIVDRVDELQHPNAARAVEDELPGLQYIGLSYGTILGNTFASMFPGRVERMIIDGVADPDDYMQGLWLANLNDSEMAVDAFYQACLDAGEACPLVHPGDTSVLDIRSRVEAWIQTLETSPRPAISAGRVRLVTSYLIRDTIRQALYVPIKLFDLLAHTLSDSMSGNFTLLWQNFGASFALVDEPCLDPELPDFPPRDYSWSGEAGMGVLCGDSYANAGIRDLEWSRRVVDALVNQSSTVGESWATVPLSCAGWSVAPKYAFAGPFGSGLPDLLSTTHKSPAAPLLILSNRVDNVTPLANAFKVSRQHTGSAVVIQESVGHCALMVSPSACTAQIIQDYFNTGKLPSNGTTCEADCTRSIPFEPCPGFL